MNLEGRQARCICGKKIPSTVAATDRAFFEYRGPGSKCAEHQCAECGYFDVAHDPGYMETLVHGLDGKRRPTVVESGRCTGFKPMPEGREFDSFYCGCRGWD